MLRLIWRIVGPDKTRGLLRWRSLDGYRSLHLFGWPLLSIGVELPLTYGVGLGFQSQQEFGYAVRLEPYADQK